MEDFLVSCLFGSSLLLLFFFSFSFFLFSFFSFCLPSVIVLSMSWFCLIPWEDGPLELGNRFEGFGSRRSEKGWDRGDSGLDDHDFTTLWRYDE